MGRKNLPCPVDCTAGSQISRLASSSCVRGLAIEVPDIPPVHQMDPDQPDEVEWPRHRLLARVSQAQQQKDGQGDEDLTSHGILGGADELADRQRLLDPTEEQLDIP